MSDKLHESTFLIETPDYLLLIKFFPFATKKDPLPCINQTECDMNWRIKTWKFWGNGEWVQNKEYGLDTICGKLFL